MRGTKAGAGRRLLREEVPELAEIPVDDLERMTASEVARAHAAAGAGRHPTADELDASAAVTGRLATAGVPLDAVNRWRRIAVRRAFEAADAPGARDVAYLYALWDWSDVVASGSAAVYRRLEADARMRAESRRTSFVRGLLDGSLPVGEARTQAPAYGLPPGGRYMAMRARMGGDGRKLERALEGDEGGALLARVDGDLWGVLTRRPEVNPADGVVGLGAESDLEGLPESFRLAQRALETAVAFGLGGAVSIDQLSLRPAILAEEDLGDRLVRRYLEPLRELGEYGAALEQTVRRYLENGMRIDASARLLIIHPNTLRHRLDRFQQLTGSDLRRTQDVVEVWWALERRRVESGGRPNDPG